MKYFLSILLLTAQLSFSNHFYTNSMGNTAFNGPIERVIYDNFENHTSESKFFIRDTSNNQKIEVVFDESIETSLLFTHLVVTLEGELLNNTFNVNNLNIEQGQLLQMYMTTPTYIRKTLIIRMNFSGFSPSQSHFSLQKAKEHFNLTNQIFQEGTWGHIQFDLDKDKDGQDDIVEVTVPFSGSCFSGDTWLNHAKPMVSSQYGLNVNEYNHVVVITPNLSSICGGIRGYASVGNLNFQGTLPVFVVSSIAFPGHSSVMPHELGHNLGFLHAGRIVDGSSLDQYSDGSSVMGNRQVSTSLNSVNINDIGAFDQFDHAKVIVNSGVYTLSPLREDPRFSDGPQILKILRPNSWDHVYVSLRNDQLLDGELESRYKNKVNIHQQRELSHFQNGHPSSGSIFRSSLSSGQSFNIDGVFVEVLEIPSNNEYAKVRITVDNQNNTANNQAPIAKEKTYYAVSNQDLNFGLEYTDADYGPGVYDFSIQTQPLHGELTSIRRKQTYRSDQGFIGLDRIKWSVHDGLLDSNLEDTLIKVLPSDEINYDLENVTLNASINYVSGKVIFNVDSSASQSSYVNCTMLFDDGQSNEPCINNQEHTYTSGYYDACALLEDADGKYMLACTQISLGGEIVYTPENAISSFVTSSFGCSSNSNGNFIMIVFLIVLHFRFTFRKNKT